MAAIEVRDLTVRYGDVTAVDGISVDVDEGEIFGLLGVNGAGKTTTVECITGLRPRTGGSVSVLGHDPAERPVDVTENVGVQLQTSALPDKITPREALAEYAAFYPDPEPVDALLESVGLTSSADRRWRTLSGGQKQRLAVALALVGRPRIAVLDELTTGLDPHARREAWRLVDAVRARGVTVLLVSHFMDEVEHLCDRVAVLDRGRIVASGTPAEIVDAFSPDAQRLEFEIEGPFDPAPLDILPEVDSVDVDGRSVRVRGHGDVVLAVTAALARNDVTAHRLRVHQSDLDDAFVSLTGAGES